MHRHRQAGKVGKGRGGVWEGGAPAKWKVGKGRIHSMENCMVGFKHEINTVQEKAAPKNCSAHVSQSTNEVCQNCWALQNRSASACNGVVAWGVCLLRLCTVLFLEVLSCHVLQVWCGVRACASQAR